MIISFYGTDLILKNIVRNWVSLLAVNTYNSMGCFTLELQNAPHNAELIKLWNYCTIDNDNDNVYVITSSNIANGKIVLTGFPATYIFSKRASTTVIRNKKAEVAMKSLVDNMTPWDNVVTEEIKGITDTFKNQMSDKQILEYLQGIGQATDMGFRLVKEGQKLVFKTYKPTINNSVKYSTSLKNVANLEYFISDNDYYNYAIVAGSEHGDKRITVTRSIGDTTGDDRRELYVDARNEQPEEGETLEDYKARLERVGLQKLAEHLKIETLYFFVEQNDNVKLGDVINVALEEYGISLQVRVVEEQLINQNNTTEKTIGVGTPMKVRRI